MQQQPTPGKRHFYFYILIMCMREPKRGLSSRSMQEKTSPCSKKTIKRGSFHVAKSFSLSPFFIHSRLSGREHK